jgi:hypothetical protein
MGFDPRVYGRPDSMTNKELTFVKNDDAYVAEKHSFKLTSLGCESLG